MLVSICVITYQRPEGIRRLMDGLNQLTFNQIEHPNIEVIVIDNDAVGSAQEFCEQIKSNFKWSLKSDIEPQRGITYARNRAISTACENADFIAMIDDDEVPEPQWLEQLLLTQQAYNADVVTGPVLHHFQSGNGPEWVKKFLQPPPYSTGDSIHVAGTNNVLVRADILRKLDPVFDERFAFTGGEDTYLFMGLHHLGYKLIWTNEAIVHEEIPKSRANLKWVLQRGYRCWNTHSLIEKELYPSIKVQTIRMVKGCGLIMIGLLLLIPSWLRGQDALIKALLYIFRGAGTLTGLLGGHYKEYKSIP